jgi:hypothetical protein
MYLWLNECAVGWAVDMCMNGWVDVRKNGG